MKRVSSLIFFLMLGVVSTAQGQIQYESLSLLPLDGTGIIHENAYLQTGAYRDTVDVNYDDIAELINRGGSDIFLIKYALDGAIQWFQSAGGSSDEKGTDLAVDAEGNIYITGTFGGAADFDYDGISDISHNQTDSAGIFLAKYTAEGNLAWVTQIDEVTGTYARMRYSTERNSLYLAIVHHNPSGLEDKSTFYLLETDTNGTLQWVNTMPYREASTVSEVTIFDMEVDEKGYSYLVGDFSGSVDFDGDGPASPYKASGIKNEYADTQFFVARYNPTGHLLWVKKSIGTAISAGYESTLDADRNIYITGRYKQGEMILEEGFDQFSGLAGTSNLFVASISPQGDLLWTHFPEDLIDDPGGYTSEAYGFSIVHDQSGTVMIVGALDGILDIDGDGQEDLNSLGLTGFLASYNDEGGSSWVIPSSYINGIYYINEIYAAQPNSYVAQGVFTDRLDIDGPGGLDPIFGPVDPDIRAPGYFLTQFSTQDSPLPVSLTSFESIVDGNDVILSWLTASETNNAGFAVLQNGEEIAFVKGAGSTNEPQSYAYRISELPPGEHTFQLKQIDFDGTFDLSETTAVFIGLESEFRLTNAFPNPFNPMATISLSVARDQQVTIALFDTLGRQVQTIYQGGLSANKSYSFQIDGSALPSGMYHYAIQGAFFNTSKPILLLK